MRIAYLCTDRGVPLFGTKGAAVHVRELTRALAVNGHDVAIWAARGGGAPPADWDIAWSVSPPATPTAFHGALTGDRRDSLARDAAGLRAARVFRHSVHDAIAAFRPDVIYERFSLFGTAGVGLARALGVPLLLEVNAPLSDEQQAHRQLGLAHVARRLEAYTLAGADRVVAVSTAVAEWAAERGGAAARITVVANGVDVDRFAPTADSVLARRQLGVPEAPTIGFAGSLKAWHGTATLVRALAQLRDAGWPARLVVVGDGPQRDALAALAAELGLSAAVTFTGAVPHGWVPLWLAAMDVAVAPYDSAAGCYFSPLKLFEYMAAARPIVASRAGQAVEVLDDGRLGLLVPPGDATALAAALAAMLADPVAAQRLGAAARARAVERHTWTQVAEQVTRLAQSAGAGCVGQTRRAA